MSGTLKLSGALKIGSLATAPSNPEVGFSYYDSVLGKYRQWDGAQWVEQADLGQLGDTANGKGASLIGIEDTAAQFTGTDVEAALAESIDAAQAAQAQLDLHENGGANKHDATEIDVEAFDGKNHSAAALETVIGELDDALGNVSALGTPSNYSTSSETEIAARLAGIDTALASAGGVDFNDSTFRISDNIDSSKKIAFEASGITTATVRTVTMPDTDVALADIATNTAHGAGNGSDHANVALNDSHRTGNGSDHANVATNTSDISNLQTALGAATEGAIAYSSNNYVTDAQDPITAIGDLDSQLGIVSTGYARRKKVISYITDNTALPPTEVSGDRYILSHDGGVPHANWDGASVGNIVEFNGTSWLATTAVEGYICYDDSVNKDRLFVNDGTPQWELRDVQSTSLTDGTIRVGNSSNVATERTLSGDVTISNTGVAALAAGAVVDADVNASAAIALSKLAAATANRALASDASGFIVASAVTDTELGYVSGVTSALQTQIDAKLANVSEDTAPSLGGDLTLGANVVIHDADGMKRGDSASTFLEEEYISSISLSASQTNAVITALTFAHASFEGMEIVYKMKEATSNNVRIGTMRVVTNGTNVVLSDMSTETADLGVSFDAVVNGTDINIRYTSDTNIVTMRADVKRFQV